jgi:hypothetical protein
VRVPAVIMRAMIVRVPVAVAMWVRMHHSTVLV